MTAAPFKAAPMNTIHSEIDFSKIEPGLLAILDDVLLHETALRAAQASGQPFNHISNEWKEACVRFCVAANKLRNAPASFLPHQAEIAEQVRVYETADALTASVTKARLGQKAVNIAHQYRAWKEGR